MEVETMVKYGNSEGTYYFDSMEDLETWAATGKKTFTEFHPKQI
jgi:hypothetical protein